MFNILIPLAGKRTFSTNKINAFPKILNEIGGKLLIERSASPFIKLGKEKKIVIAVPQEESDVYRLDKVLPLLGSDVVLCNINSDTKGALCSALLAIEKLDLDSPLIISSFEQVFDFEIDSYIKDFVDNDVDAGVLTFESIHPKWSYVKVNSEGLVTEAAEKVPISKNAIAGFYYFKTARKFIDAAKSMIRKDVKTNDYFYISPSLNEIILGGGFVKALEIDKKRYYHINDEHSLESYEESVLSEKKERQCDIYKATEKYVMLFHNKDIKGIENILSEKSYLSDPNISLSGKNSIVEYISKIFKDAAILNFQAKKIIVSSGATSVIEFELQLNGQHFVGTDVIEWDSNFNLLKMHAYLYEKVK